MTEASLGQQNNVDPRVGLRRVICAKRIAGSGNEIRILYFIVLSMLDLNINMAQLGIAKCFKKTCGRGISVGDSHACTPAKKPRKSPTEKQGCEYKMTTAKIEA